MKVRYPKYYEKFSCIAGACEDTCCAGWEIDIDDGSYEYYMQIPGKIGRRLRENMKEYRQEDDDVYESHGFILTREKRCPFLNEDNLCDLILELGEDAICDVCTNTPRNFLEYGNAREISLSPSCAEAGRLIFGSREKVTFVEKEVDETLDIEESEEDLVLADAIRRARDMEISVLQNREQDIYHRICDFLQYAEQVQEYLNRGEFDGIPAWAGEYEVQVKRKESAGAHKDADGYLFFRKRLESFQGLESINEEWEQYIDRLAVLFLEEEKGRKRYEGLYTGFRKYLREKDKEYLFEQLMVYYAFLCLARSVDDFDFLGKAKLCVSSFLMIQDMALERFYQNAERFTEEDCVDIARIYAKEVEHSQENLEYLEDEFLFEDIYKCDALCVQVQAK